MHRRHLVPLTIVHVTAIAMVATIGLPIPPGPTDARRPHIVPPPELAAERDAPVCGDALMRQLTDPSAAVRAAAARRAGEVSLPHAAEARTAAALVELAGGVDLDVALEAALALSRLRQDPGPLLAHAFVRGDGAGAAAGLRDLPGESAITALRALAGPADPEIRAVALVALAERDPLAAEPLIESALMEEFAVVRLAALRGAVEAPQPRSVDRLRECLDAADPLERTLASAALARLGDDAATQRLRAEMESSLLAAELAARVGLSGAAEAWTRLLHRAAPEDQARTLLALRGRLPSALAPAVQDELRAPARGLRVAAAVTLAEAGDSGARAVVESEMSASDDPAVRAEAELLLTLLSVR